MDSSADVPNTILTAAESFPSGEAVELLANGQLLLSTPGGEPVIGSSVSWANNRYGPVPLDPSLQQVLRLPDHIEAFGTTEELVRDLVRFLGSISLACFVLTTWLADVLPTLPLLNLWGQPGTENSMVDVLSCLCRRALPVALPALGELFSLPRNLDPTLILRVRRERDVASLLAATAHSGGGEPAEGPPAANSLPSDRVHPRTAPGARLEYSTIYHGVLPPAWS